MKYRVYNSTLNPELWNDLVLKEEIRSKLIKIANDFYTELELSAPLIDIRIIGSNTNYNWTSYSDVDLHLILDLSKINSDTEQNKKLADALRTIYNIRHNIYIKNHKVEVYIEDVTENTRSTGVYSLLKNAWLRMPEKENVILDQNLIKQKYKVCVLQVNNAIQSNNVTLIKNVIRGIYNMREVGLSGIGEYSVENVVFKMLRSFGYIDKLREAAIKIYDSQVSINK